MGQLPKFNTEDKYLMLPKFLCLEKIMKKDFFGILDSDFWKISLEFSRKTILDRNIGRLFSFKKSS